MTSQLKLNDKSLLSKQILLIKQYIGLSLIFTLNLQRSANLCFPSLNPSIILT